jgi:PleD family two-component response regulator
MAVQHLNIEDNGSYLAITISCGISEFPTDSNKETQVLALADKALYAAKNGGRNQVVSWLDTEHDTNHKP